VRLNRLWEKWQAEEPSAAKAGTDFAALTAQLKAAPFQNKIKTGFFPQRVYPLRISHP
jgi:hypothetical protein